MANSENHRRTPARNSGAPRDIEERTLAFALRVLRLVEALPNGRAVDVIARQLARAGTSIGANIEEAQGAQSRAEFVRRMNIARSEARETLYWLRLLARAGYLKSERLSAILAEADELVRILVTIVKRARMAKERS